jgi:hypothetical protein
MGKITKELLISKGVKEPNGKSYSTVSRSYCKLWSIGNFNLKIIKNGNLQVFETINGELIKTIKDENVLDAFIIFAIS